MSYTYEILEKNSRDLLGNVVNCMNDFWKNYEEKNSHSKDCKCGIILQTNLNLLVSLIFSIVTSSCTEDAPAEFKRSLVDDICERVKSFFNNVH